MKRGCAARGRSSNSRTEGTGDSRAWGDEPWTVRLLRLAVRQFPWGVLIYPRCLGHGGSFVVGYPVRTTRTVKEPPLSIPQFNRFWDIPGGAGGRLQGQCSKYTASVQRVIFWFRRQKAPSAGSGICCQMYEAQKGVDSSGTRAPAVGSKAPRDPVGEWRERCAPCRAPRPGGEVFSDTFVCQRLGVLSLDLLGLEGLIP